MRQHLLKENKIKETEITLQNIKEFSHFQLINSMNDFDDNVYLSHRKNCKFTRKL